MATPVNTSDANASSVEEQTMETVDDLLRHRAACYPDHVAVSYPSSGVNYVDYTLRQLDALAWASAQHYMQQLPLPSTNKPAVVALLGPSNLEYLVTILAIVKLGHTALLLSTRITPEAIAALVRQTGCNSIIVDDRHAQKVAFSSNTTILPLTNTTKISGYPCDTRIPRSSKGNASDEMAFIIHSSGSTGLPKPIYQTHKSCLANYANGLKMNGLITLPLFHNHGLCNLFRAIYAKTSLRMYNADLPLTQDHLVTILRKHSCDVFYAVPYALKLLSESPKGIEELRKLKVVMYGGSACPDDLGEKLVTNGVHLVSHYGATEVGQLMTSHRPHGDIDWNYVRETDNLTPYLDWVPRGKGLFECCVKDGWPAKVASNQPDGSYATKDLFEPHPSIPRAWKYIARLDDTIVLVNGEKFNPVAMEGSVRCNEHVAEAVVFGASRHFLGILVVPSKIQDVDIDTIWPIIKAASDQVDSFARISRDMVVLLPPDCDYPRTDKGSIIRQAFYKMFQGKIDDAYDAADLGSAHVKTFTESELRSFIRSYIQGTFRAGAFDDSTDFFQLGLDSLAAIQIRSELLKTVHIGNRQLGQNVVFDYPSVLKLCKHLLCPETVSVPVEDEMRQMIDKYSSRGTVVLTGATGSLGAHVLACLASKPAVTNIYCLVRAPSKAEAKARVVASLKQRKLPAALHDKFIALPCDLSQPRLGLQADDHLDIITTLNAVIHCAWSVNFNMQLASFNTHVAGVTNLIRICELAGASMNFCSSVSTCSRAPASIPEAVAELTWAQETGYARSKAVGEHLCAWANVTSRILRVGQIIGDTVHGIWNADEAIPLMMQTASTMGALPRLDDTLSWLPVDVAAQAVVDISLSDAGGIVANVTNPKTIHWTNDLLPILRTAGLDFEEVESAEWLRRLETSSKDPEANPPIKLLDFFTAKYTKPRGNTASFVTDQAESYSPALANASAMDEIHAAKIVQRFKAKKWGRQR